jgi:DNA (cytosine-5)-methyltransferase 1
LISSSPRGFRALDLFAGAGGSTCGAAMAGVQVVAAVDAWELACATYQDNNPLARVYHSKCEDLDPRRIQKEVGKLDLILASPECTSHTCAKGNANRCEASRNTAFQVSRYATTLKPRWIIVENVIQMQRWHRYAEFVSGLEAAGYHVSAHVFNAVDFGVPQSRRRLFLICQLGRPLLQIVPPGVPQRTASDIIDKNGTYEFSPLRDPRRARATLERADRAITAVGEYQPFLLVYYGSDGSGGWQRLGAPLRTITTLDRFAYVRRRNGDHEMRMLQVPELKQAMGFPTDYKLRHGNRRDRIKLLGNAVCPPVMRHIVKSMIAVHLA